MNQADLKKALRLFPTTISILGKEDLLRDEAKAAILDVFAKDPDLRAFNVDTVEGQPNRDSRAILAAEPVSAQFRLVWLDSPNPDAFLQFKPHNTVLVATAKPFKSSQLEIDCNRMYGQRLRAWVRAEAKRQKVELDKSDVEVLLEDGNTSLRSIRDAVEKISLSDPPVTHDKIRLVSHSLVNTTGWDVTRYATSGLMQKAASALERAKASGAPVTHVIAAMQTVLLNVRDLYDGNTGGMSDFEKERLEKVKVRFSRAGLDVALDDCLAAELAAKSGDQALVDLRLAVKIAKASS